ncbi:MAG: FAD-dependent oxidoreductase [Actinobacteria bacterium]|nr:FAD-dependent oxidoreductase [Actinomycetota bacterium]
MSRTGRFLVLALASQGRFPELAAELHDETGIDVGWRERATLRVAESDEESAELQARVAWQRSEGLQVEWLDEAAVPHAEPLLAEGVRGALRSARDGVVTSGWLTAALAARARIRGASFVVAAPGARVLRAGERIDGLQVGASAMLVGELVIAAGPWSAAVARDVGIGPLPVRPVKGQLAVAHGQRAPEHTIFSAGGYVAGKAEGVVIAGATVEERGFDTAIDDDAHARLVARAVGLVPTLDPAAFALRWAGLRPALPDLLPALGRTKRARNVLVATGHFRNGILLAPITAAIITAALTGERTPFDLAPFSPDRFAGEGPRVGPQP